MASQNIVQERYIEKMKVKCALYKKRKTALIRRAKEGEIIETFIDGKYETSNTIRDQTSYVVYGVKGETYVLSERGFQENYEKDSAKSIQDSYLDLHRQGYREYASKRKVWAYEVTKEDIEWFRTAARIAENQDRRRVEEKYGDLEEDVAYFVAPWGEAMRLEVGDFLVTQYPSGNDEIYRVERNIFSETYECFWLVENEKTNAIKACPCV